MEISIDELIDYVFGDLPTERQSAIRAFVKTSEFYPEIVMEITELKNELGSKNRVKAYLLEQKSKIGGRLFPEDSE